MNLYLDKIASTDDDDDGGSDDREHEGGALVSDTDTAHDATVAEEIVEQGPVADTSFFSLIHCQQVLMMMMKMMMKMIMMMMMMIYVECWFKITHILTPGDQASVVHI